MLCGDGSARLFRKVCGWMAVLLSVPPELGRRRTHFSARQDIYKLQTKGSE
jgi:hypothetical protein